MNLFEYDGLIYVRPCSRGIVLENSKLELEDILSDGTYKAKIIITKALPNQSFQIDREATEQPHGN